MSIYENVKEFASKPVAEWTPETGIADPAAWIYRIGLTWDESEEEKSWTDKFAEFLSDPNASQVTGLVIGGWDGVFEQSGDTTAVVEALVSAREHLPNLTALFLGDVVSEECEISWLQQSDVAPLLEAYPSLEYFAVRGGAGLSLGTPRNARLRSLVIQTGGLPIAVVQEVCAADLPALEHLELYFGSINYGGDATVADIAPLLTGKLFPKLTSLGLRDSEFTDAIAAAIAAAPVLDHLQVLDLSLGTLGDEGAEALLASPGIRHLQKLDLHHHYCSAEMTSRLQDFGKSLGIEIDVSEREDESKYGRYVAVSE